jgi:hypothetical protein
MALSSLGSKVSQWLTADGLMLLECWCRDGFTIEDICNKMGVTQKTLYEWRKTYPEIRKAFDTGREIVDYRVENALLKSALGYRTKEVKTFINKQPDKDGNIGIIRVETTEKEIAPNVTAIAVWLNNRKPDQWKRNRDNVLELKDEDSKITVNIIKHSSKKSEDEEEWNTDTEEQTTKAETTNKSNSKNTNIEIKTESNKAQTNKSTRPHTGHKSNNVNGQALKQRADAIINSTAKSAKAKQLEEEQWLEEDSHNNSNKRKKR